MKISDLNDIAITEDGDLQLINDSVSLDENYNDIYVALGISAIKQAILMRLYTELKSCGLYPSMGHDLDTMRGKRNTKENVYSIQAKIKNCLTYGDLFDILEVVPIPTGASTVMYYISIITDDGVPYNMSLEYDFENGLRWV